MIRLHVWLVTSFDSALRAGELVVAEPDGQGRLLGQFRYSPEYLASPDSIALDPINLPLREGIFDAGRPHSGVHGVFEDSLPDDWGRRLLIRRHGLTRGGQRVPQLLKVLGGNAMGALRYSEEERLPEPLPLVESRQLEKLEQLARAFEADPLAVEDDIALLFQAASSPGGARPKALVHDDKGTYLAKFASAKDIFDVVSLEAAAMYLARLAGLAVAAARCLPCGERKALLVERFDLDRTSRRRHHCISMQSLLRADGFYNFAYTDMAEVIRQISSDPNDDLRKLYRQMVFNVLIGNTDDHLKNFTMLNNGHGWMLSPAYDLVPNIGLNSEHVLRFDLAHMVPDRPILTRLAKAFGLKQSKAIDRELEAVIDAVAGWRDAFEMFGVPELDIRRIGGDIDQRLARIKR